MLTSVNQLSACTLRNTVISEHVHEILGLINKNITRENKLGNNQITYNLPIVFRNVHNSHETTCTIIYTTVMKELEQKGYTVKIKREKDHPVLIISWSSGINNSELLLMEQYLRDHSI